MKSALRSTITRLKWVLPVCVAAVLFSMPSQVRADEVTVAGTTTGTFSGTGDFTSTGLTFASSSFDTTTSGGFGSINLGTFALGPDPSIYNGSFDLDVTFTLPTGISGGNASTFTANLMGNVVNSTTGAALLLNFNPGMETYSFSNGSDAGSFTLIVPSSISVTEGGSSTLTAAIVGSEQPVSAPEPGTLLMSAIGLLGICAAYRKYGVSSGALGAQA